LAGVSLALLGFDAVSAPAGMNAPASPTKYKVTTQSSIDPLVPAMFDCSKIKQLGIDRQENLRPIILNGIEEIATRSDLLDRCIVLELPVIAKEKRRPEADFWREFEQVRPGILGALLIIALPNRTTSLAALAR
jgi:hypothetical protein